MQRHWTSAQRTPTHNHSSLALQGASWHDLPGEPRKGLDQEQPCAWVQGGLCPDSPMFLM